jgi:hypothetical protein
LVSEGVSSCLPRLELLRQLPTPATFAAISANPPDPGHAGWLTPFVSGLCGTSARAAL